MRPPEMVEAVQGVAAVVCWRCAGLLKLVLQEQTGKKMRGAEMSQLCCLNNGWEANTGHRT